MKKLFAITVLLVGFALSSNAQQTPTTPEERKEARKTMKDELNLSKEQAEELKTLNQNFRTKAKDIKSNESLSQEQKKEQIKSLNKERTDKMNTILTPEQQDKIRNMKKAGHPRKHKQNKEQ